MTPLVSVIVPVHNNEQWLPTCINSIRKQTYPNLEILLIDDGSNDVAADLCDAYAELDMRIQVHHIKRSGVSRARNVGLEYATGEYVTFVDSDDFLDLNAIYRVMRWQMLNSKYLCKWNCSFVGEDGQIKKCVPQFTHTMDSVRWKASIIGGNYGADIGCTVKTVWGSMFCLEIIRKNHLRFVEELYIGEDAVFLLEYINFTLGIAFLDYAGYYYRIHSVSASRRYKADLIEQQVRQLQEIIRRLSREERKDKIIKEAITGFIWSGFNALINNSRKGWIQKQIRIKDITKEAFEWIQDNKKNIQNGNVRVRTAGKFVFFEYLLSYFIPIRIICALSLWHSIWKKR